VHHNWCTKKESLIFKGLQKTTLDLFLSYIIIVVVDCCMPIDKMMSCKINKNILKQFGYYVNVILSSINLTISNV
jgi:hypothetical protein